MALMVLFVLVAIVIQINITTRTDSRVARNDVALTTMDLAIESGFMQVYQELLDDGEADAASGDEAPGGTGPGAGTDGAAGPNGGGGGEDGGEEQASDSRMDTWAQVKRPVINEIELRVYVQDEDSKLNVLGMLTEDEEEAEKVYERVVRVLDMCREETSVDIDSGDARRMADEIRRYLQNRDQSDLPRPRLLTDDPDDEDVGLPLSLREFLGLEPFHEDHFRDFRDQDGTVVHSIGSYLTVWSSIATAESIASSRDGDGDSADDEEGDEGDEGDEDEGDEGDDDEGDEGDEGDDEEGDGETAGEEQETPSGLPGVAVNVNTAPPVVLMALMDDRDLAHRIWDRVVEYRNLEEEDEDGEEVEPIYDEFGEEQLRRQFFDSIGELDEVYGWSDLPPTVRGEVERLLTTTSQVFSIYITARKLTSANKEQFSGYLGNMTAEEEDAARANALTRTVRSVVWRYEGTDGIEIVPLVRWEVVDYTPWEVLDYPDEDR